MDTFLNVFKMVLPVLIVIAIGFVCRRKKLITDTGIVGMKTAVTDIMLPVVLFNALATAKYSISIVIIFAIIIVVNTIALGAGFLSQKLLGSHGKFSPFLMAGGEVGMLGYALYSLLFGNDKLFYLASVDLGNIFFCFTVYLAILLSRAGGKPGLKSMTMTVLKNPCFIGATLGTIVGASGLGNLILSSPAGGIFTETISLVTAPTSTLILLIVGFDFTPKKDVLKPVLKATLLRFLIMGAMCAVASLVLFAIVPYEKEQLFAFILYFTLPAPLFIPIYANSEEENGFISTALSLYMAITIIAFTVMAVSVSL